MKWILFTSLPKSELIYHVNLGSFRITAAKIRRYLLHQISGPFLKAAISHQTIALACLIYISQSITMFGNSVDHAEFRSNLLKTHHSIHYYAYEFWLEHLLEGVGATATYPDSVSYAIATHSQGLLAARKPLETINTKLSSPDPRPKRRPFVDDLPFRGDIVEMIQLLTSFHNITRKGPLDHETLEGQSPNLQLKP